MKKALLAILLSLSAGLGMAESISCTTHSRHVCELHEECDRNTPLTEPRIDYQIDFRNGGIRVTRFQGDKQSSQWEAERVYRGDGWHYVESGHTFSTFTFTDDKSSFAYFMPFGISIAMIRTGTELGKCRKPG